MPNFVIVKNCKNVLKPSRRKVRDMKFFNEEHLIKDLNDINLSLLSELQNTDEMLN